MEAMGDREEKQSVSEQIETKTEKPGIGSRHPAAS